MVASNLEAEVERFQRDGYLVVRQLASAQECAALRSLAGQMLDPLQGPVEFEADVGYPGAPKSKLDAGGTTPRRLLHAYSRDPLLRAWARDPRVGQSLEGIFRRTHTVRVAVSPQLHHDQAPGVFEPHVVAPGHPLLVVSARGPDIYLACVGS